MRHLIFSLSLDDWQERNRRMVENEKQVESFKKQASNDMKQGSRPLFTYEIFPDGSVQSTKIS